MPDKFVPFSARGKPEEAAKYEALIEGVPPHMRSSIQHWLDGVFDGHYDEYDYGVHEERLRALELMIRHPVDWSDGPRRAYNSFREQCEESGFLALNAVDWALHASLGDRGNSGSFCSSVGRRTTLQRSRRTAEPRAIGWRSE